MLVQGNTDINAIDTIILFTDTTILFYRYVPDIIL